MKTAICITAGIAVMLLTGCSNQDGPLDTGGADNGTAPFAVAKSSAPREIVQDESIISTQASSVNAFAIDMYKQLAGADENVFFSPYSIVAALGMTEAGAREETARQIREALSVSLEGDDFHAALNGLDLSLMGHAQDADGVTLNIVNTTWAQSGWDFRVAYLDLLARYYGAGVNLLDFATRPEPSRVIINTWVADQTNQRIEDLIPEGTITSNTVLVLTNAIYFLADWLYQFDASLTSDTPFYRLDNTTVLAPLMQLGKSDEKVTMLYARSGAVRAVDFPYKGDRLCMTVLLPDRDSFPSFENGLSVESVNAIIGELDSAELPPVRLPRFTFTTGSISLADPLKALGMVDAFVAGLADFSGIDGSLALYVGDVIHKAFIAVDEKGTEAAAATAVVIDYRSGSGDSPGFIADRPFIFLIRDRMTGTILFMGKIVDPTT